MTSRTFQLRSVVFNKKFPEKWPAAGSAEHESMFRVQVAGLVKATQHNGRFGTVVCELESGRLRVILDGDGQELSLKRCNIEPIGGPTPQQRRLTEEIDALVDDRNWQGLVKMAQEAHAVVCAVRGPFPQIAAQILIKLGKAHQSLREFDQAIEVLSQAQSISAQVGHRAGVADACSALASCFGVMGDGNSAIAYSRKHREMAEMLGDVQGESRACNNLGVHCANAGRHAEAIEPFQRAIDIAEQREHDQAAESRLRLCLGDCYAKQGQIEDAKGQQNRALKIAIQCGDAECAGTACINIGHCFQAQTRYAVAVELYEQGLSFARQVEGFAGLEMQGAAWNNLGACFQALGLYERAMMSHQKAQNMASQVQNKEQERNACANMGRCCMALRLYDAALVQLQKASDISKLSLDHASTGHLCVELGECYRLMSQEDKAHRVLSEARRIAIARHDAAADGAACAGLGKCFISQRNYAEAISVLEEALSIAKGSDGTKQPTREGSARNNLGVALKLSGDFEGAACAFGHAISMLQRVEHVAGEDDAWRVSIFEEQQLAYRNLQGVLLGVGEDPAAGDSSSHHNEMGLEKLSARRRWALGVAEQSKARALVHRLRGVGSGGGHDRNTGRDNNAGSTDAGATEGKKLTYEAMCEVWWAEVQTLAREEGDGTCVVEYSFVSQDQLAIWVVSSGGELLAQEISRCEVSTATSNADAVGVRGAMGQLLKDLRDNMEVEGRAAVASDQVGGGSLPTDDADLPPSKRGRNCRTCGQRLDQCTCPTLREQREVKLSVQLQELYRLLIEPVDQHLAGAEELLIIPHQELFEVPWAALTDADGRYLIERHVLRVAPSLRVARMVARDSMQPTQLHAVNPHAVIVGNPQPIPAAFASLPLAEKEAQQICETLEHAVAGLQVRHFANSEVQMCHYKYVYCSISVCSASHGLGDNSKVHPPRPQRLR